MRKVKVVDDGGVVILTDMFGSTPPISRFRRKMRISKLWPVWPAFVELISVRNSGELKEVAIGPDAGRKYINAASAVLEEAS